MSSAILKSFKWCSPAIQKLCEADPEFAGFLISQTHEQRQCLAFVVLGWEHLETAKFSPRELGKKVRYQSKKALLKEFVRPYPAGLISVLKKLGNKIMIKDRYLELIDLLAEPNAAKFLWHEPKIHSRMIAALVGLDPVFRRPSIVRNIMNEATLHSVQYAIAVARKASQETSDATLAKSLEGTLSHDPHQIWLPIETKMVLQEWLTHRLNKIVFPEPPWKGTLKLRPLTSCQDIIKTAKSFDNCLAREMARVIGKKRYFYVWQERGTAVVALENEPLLGWIVGDIKGPQNKTVSKRTKERIIEELQVAGIEEYQGAQAFNLYD